MCIHHFQVGDLVRAESDDHNHHDGRPVFGSVVGINGANADIAVRRIAGCEIVPDVPIDYLTLHYGSVSDVRTIVLMNA